MPQPHPTQSLETIVELAHAWRRVLRQRRIDNSLDVAHKMVQLLVDANHDEWWSDDPEQPLVARIAELILALETPETWLPDWSNLQHNAMANGELKLEAKQLEHWIAQRRQNHWREVIDLVAQLLKQS